MCFVYAIFSFNDKKKESERERKKQNNFQKMPFVCLLLFENENYVIHRHRINYLECNNTKKALFFSK